MHPTVAVLGVLLVSALPLQQQEAGPAGAISGRVVRAGAADPVVRADVTLTRIGGTAADARVAVTDDGGAFTFDGLAPGEYRVAAERNGFVSGAYHSPGSGQPGAPIAVAGGLRREIVLELTPASVISGRILDEFGEPIPNVSVRALKAVYAGRERVFEVKQQTQTNDLGEYRLFGLNPGYYYVLAVPARNARIEGDRFVMHARSPEGGDTAVSIPLDAAIGRGTVPASLLREDRDLPVYFPGVVDPSSAEAIHVPAGVDYRGADLLMRRAPAARLSGVVRDGLTGEPSRVPVTLWPRAPRSGSVASIGSVSSEADGRFVLENIPPGRYVIVARTGPAQGRDYGLAANVAVDVGLADLENIPLIMQPEVTLAGRLIVEDRPAEALRPGAIRIAAHPLWPVDGPPPAAVYADGSFYLDGVPASDYWLEVTGLPEGYYLKEVRLGRTNALDGFRVDPQISDRLEVVVSPSSGAMDILVVNDRQQPVSGAAVWLLPEEIRRHRAALTRAITTDASGRARIQGIAPGVYAAYAWSAVEADAWRDVEFLRSHENSGFPVRVEERSAQALTLRAIN